MVSPRIELTIVIATRNGEQVLPRVLDGYCGAIRPLVDWKIVVADDGSTDSSRDIVESYRQHLPLELLALPARGKSHALNCGINAVEGRYVIFADDDTIPDMYFLVAWLEAFKKRSDHGIFGGSVELFFETSPPKWIRDASPTLASVLAARQLPEGPVEWDEIYGSNMAVRREIFEEGFRFDESIGPGSDRGNRFGEDSEFCRRVAKAGVGCWFAKDPLVRHIVRPRQLTKKALTERAYLIGRGRAYLMLRRGPFEPPQLTWRERLNLLSPMASQRYESLFKYHLSRGFHDECARSAAPP